VVPVDVNRTVVRFQWHSYQPLPNPETDARWNELARISKEVQAEDAHIYEAVQLNIGSRANQPGRYSPKRESGVQLFHQLLGRA
jgi:phenylpropionate dioxygenase-like ring-hydroxylating dioxygenase large terminal subunit